MMTCKELSELLFDFLDGALPKEHSDLISHHLSLCPPCVNFVESYKITVKVCRQLPPMDMPPELVERLRLALKQIKQKEAPE
jgi:predicted anti-sigma-YlaC factor YlaD